jgi:uncharacterized protein (TIGR02145 family)
MAGTNGKRPASSPVNDQAPPAPASFGLDVFDPSGKGQKPAPGKTASTAATPATRTQQRPRRTPPPAAAPPPPAPTPSPPPPRKKWGCWTYLAIGILLYIARPAFVGLWSAVQTVQEWVSGIGGTPSEDEWRERYTTFRQQHRVVHDGADSIIVLGPTGAENRNYYLRAGKRYRIDMGTGGTSNTRTASDRMPLNVDRVSFEQAAGSGDITAALRTGDILTMNIIARYKDITFNELEDDLEVAYLKDGLDHFRAGDTLTRYVPRHAWNAVLDGERALGELLALTPATVQVEGTTWMAHDLRTRLYANGDAIPVARSDEEWKQYAAQRTGCLRALPNGTVVYSGHAVFDERGIAPAGFHVPAARALQSLVKDADGATAQALAAYALGTADSTLFNSTNFGARQGGHVDGDGRMVHGACSCWWSSTVRRGKAKALCIGGCDAPADGSDRSFPMDAGLAVRCMKR